MPYLPNAMESLLSQSERNFELLVIDDGSTDDSLAYLRSIRDPRVRVLTQENRGLTTTLNRMLAEVNTPWLMRHDADDFAYPQRVQRTLEHIKRHPDAGMFYSLADYKSGGKRVGTFRTTQGTPERLRELVQHGYLLSICHITVTLNVEKATDVGSYRFDLYVEDIDLWWRMALKYDIQFIPEVTAAMRHNLKSVSARNFRAQVLSTLYVQYLLISRLQNREPLPLESVKGVLEEMLQTRTLRFRDQIRRANVSISERAYLSAIRHAALAFAASPNAFSRRVLYELFPKKTVQIGENPERFVKKELWPSVARPAAPELARRAAV